MRMFRNAMIAAMVGLGVSQAPAQAQYYDGKPEIGYNSGYGYRYAPPPVYYAPPRPIFVPPPVYYAPPRFIPPPVYYAPRPFYGRQHWGHGHGHGYGHGHGHGHGRRW